MHDAPSFLTRGNGHGSSEGPRAGARRAEATIATGDMLDVRRFQVTQRMSALFEVHLVAVSDNPDIDFEAAIGMPMSFRVLAAHTRTWSGVCSHLRQIAVEERNLSTYEITLVPALWLLTQRRNHRMFQRMSEVDIARKILGEWGIPTTLKLGGTYKKRKVRVQYGESDFTFVSRMLEDAGVSFYDDAEGGGLVLDDGPHHNAARAPLAFRDNPTDTDQEHVTQVRVGRRLRPGKYTVRDHDHRRPPAFKLMATSAVGGVEGSLERFHYAPGAFVFESDKGEAMPQADDKGKFRADEAEGARVAERRLDAERASAREVSFLTNVVDPAPGTVLSFLDHPKSELGPGKRLLVVESQLSGEVPGLWTHACTAVSAEAPYRPPAQAKKPRVHGVESATVVGPPGEEIHVDELGRVRVHFHWDRESKMNDDSSAWIPVSQPWGGAGFGGTNLPRVGQEVIVDFLGGNPDRPVIVGRVFTALQKTPYKLPENKTQSGWKSSSTRGTGGYNEIMFEDAAGRELVRMQAERDLDELVKHDQRGKVGNDRTANVGHDDRIEVGNDRATQIGHDEALDVDNDRVTTVGHDDERIVGHDASTLVGNNAREVVGMSRSRAVGASESVEVAVSQSITVGEAQSTRVGGAQSVEVGGAQSVQVGGAQSVTVGKASTETVGLAKALTVGAAYQITVGAAMNTTVVGISAEEVGFEKKIMVGHKLEIVCGKSKIVLERSGKVTIEGTEIDLKSEGPINIDGKKITVKGTEVSVTASGPAELHGDTVKLVGNPIDFN
ncbi:MAG: type VI secretion system tip protein TssI/VgrG [Minicystis sp.]